MKLPRAALCAAILSLTQLPIQAAPSDRIVVGAEAKKGLAVVDPSKENAVLFHHPIGQVHDLHLLENGNFLTQDGWTKIVEISPTKGVVWTYDGATQNRENPDQRIEIHAYQPLIGGRIMVAESGASRILEIDRDGTIQKQFPLAVPEPSPHSDTRLVRKLENGHYLVAHEAAQAVKEYDGEGKVVWEFGIPLFGKEPKKGHGPDAFGGKCFSAFRTQRGTTLISTGNGHSVLEVTPEKEIIWQLHQNDLPGIVLAWVTNIEERPDGTLMIGNCHAGPENPQIIEITREKEVVWSFHDFETFGNALANTLVLDGDEATTLRKQLAKANP